DDRRPGYLPHGGSSSLEWTSATQNAAHGSGRGRRDRRSNFYEISDNLARLSDYLHYRPGDVDWHTAQANVRTIFALFAEHGIVTLSDEPDPLVELTDSGYRQFVVAEGLLAQRN
ncbi:MAG TPA: hypothetical protein VFB26_11780, partial [Gaiellaceae bacterium]|nr:hypothetical protein [Gaiellaceae bacterium]